MNNILEILIFERFDLVADFALDKWVEISSETVREKAYFAVALSGGRTPIDFYSSLARSDHKLPWDRTHVFLTDERFVPWSDSESNYRLVKEHLLDHIDMPKQNVYPISTEGVTPQQSAARYEENIRRPFGIGMNTLPEFDLIMLGIGEDGHTASLFPGAPALQEQNHLAVPVIADKAPHQRISLTLPVINNSKNIIFLVSGKNKANAIREIVEDENSMLPTALVRPTKGSALLLLDEAAASLLSEER